MKETQGAATQRNIWTGAISFGLVQIPVGLRSATVEHELQFHMLDKRDFSPIHNQRLSKKSEKPVEWGDLVKGYEVARGKFVVLTDDDFKRANLKASETLEIIQFVEQAEIDPIYFDKPYYLVPLRAGAKPYALLRDALHRSKRVGVAKLVLRTREHLAILRVYKDALVVNLLRFEHELRSPADLKLPQAKRTSASSQELKLAGKLIDGMTGPWKPESFHDTYREDLLALIEQKRRSGPHSLEASGDKKARPQAEIIDLMAQLKRSLGASEEGPKRRKKSKKKKAG